jgi:hypothetical protein
MLSRIKSQFLNEENQTIREIQKPRTAACGQPWLGIDSPLPNGVTTGHEPV